VDVVLGYVATLAVSTAAGLNAYLPLLLLGILSRSTDLVTLTRPWDALEEPWVLAVIAAIAVVDFVGDKVPVVDHVLHLIGVAIAPIAGGVAAMAAAGSVDVAPGLAAVMGIAAALATQVGRSAARPVSTVGTGGVATPAVSLAEDGASATLTVLAFAAPVLALLALLAIAVLVIRAVGRWRALGRRLEAG
jgi:hypothetical protein